MQAREVYEEGSWNADEDRPGLKQFSEEPDAEELALQAAEELEEEEEGLAEAPEGEHEEDSEW